jgi:hypothetical protein
MSFRPIGYTKEHPVAVITCIVIGMGLSHYGIGLSMLPGVNVRGGAKASVGDDD